LPPSSEPPRTGERRNGTADVVAATTAQYLELIDKALPGQVAGLYLTGSVPLGDFHPGSSDIDRVVILASPLESSEPLKEVHAALPAKPAYDVTYLTAAELAVPPDREKPVVFTLDGVFKVAPHGGPVSPVLWSEMARNAVPVRTAPGLVVHDDQQALRDFTHGNLTSYWEPTLDKVATAVDSLPDEQVLDEFIVPWCTLGVPRLHALLVTGEIVSKTAAGGTALPRSLSGRCCASAASTTERVMRSSSPLPTRRSRSPPAVRSSHPRSNSSPSDEEAPIMDAKAQTTMIKDELHRCLQDTRTSLLSKLDGLSEHSLHRPMTSTGTNLLGVVKHLGGEEYGYLGEIFGRPPLEPAPAGLVWLHESVDWDEETKHNPDVWARTDELSDYILGCRSDTPHHERRRSVGSRRGTSRPTPVCRPQPTRR
jgi:hypothetical protein